MSALQQAGRPITRVLQHGTRPRIRPASCIAAARHLSQTATHRAEDLEKLETASRSDNGAPIVLKQGSGSWRDNTPGSKRLLAALEDSENIPFEQLPYQCFQEARKILAADRAKKVEEITALLERIRELESTAEGGEEEAARRKKSIVGLRSRVDRLKILADTNDPFVKRRFEDGLGDMTKPIYRYLSEKRWRAMDAKVTAQRVSQFFVVPDLLQKFDATMDVKLYWRGDKISPGSILPSTLTEKPPTLRMQVFDGGERLLSVAVVDADVPDPEADRFTRRCHFLAANIPWSPTSVRLPLSAIGATAGADKVPGSIAVPWLPPTAQKGAPYHRLAVFVYEQARDASGTSVSLDPAKLAELYNSEAGRFKFGIKGFRDRWGATPVGFTIFRTQWDETMAEVMARHGIPGADVEFKRPRVHSLKPHRKARGWEAKRQGPKFKFLWKYTKNIRYKK